MSPTPSAAVAESAKPRSLDEFFDMIFCRPLGRSIARRVAASTNLTANHVSLIAGVFGFAAGVLFAFPWPSPALGSIAMLIYMVLDCADGEVARIKGGGGWRGRMIDGWADFITAFAVHFGMVMFLWTHGVPLFGVVLPLVAVFFVAGLAGASHMWNSGVVDGLKQALKDQSVDREATKIVCDANGLFERALWWTFQVYMSGLSRVDRRLAGDYPLYRRTQWVGPTHHHLLMVVSGLLVGLSPASYYGFFLFCCIPMNLYLAAVLRLGRRAQSDTVTA